MFIQHVPLDNCLTYFTRKIWISHTKNLTQVKMFSHIYIFTTKNNNKKTYKQQQKEALVNIFVRTSSNPMCNLFELKIFSFV